MLSAAGRTSARRLGERRRDDGISAVFASDLARSVETAEIAFGGSGLPIVLDWRLRECDYGELNGAPTEQVHGRRVEWIDRPYPGGESWTEAVARVGGFLEDLPSRWNGARVLVIGHVATRWGLNHHLDGVPLADLVDAEFVWQEGWEFELVAGTYR